MSSTLRKRVQRLASRLDELTPPAPRQTLTILFEPRKEASASVWETFGENLETAKQQFAAVHVFMDYQTKSTPRTEGNVVYEPFDMHRLGEVLAAKRNPEAAKSKYDTVANSDWWSSLEHQIIGVATETPANDEDDDWP